MTHSELRQGSSVPHLRMRHPTVNGLSALTKLVPALQQVTVGLREAVLVLASLVIAPVAELGKFADCDYKMRLESYRNHIYTRSVETCYYYYYLVFL